MFRHIDQYSDLLKTLETDDERLKHTIDFLSQCRRHYHWVGIYLLERNGVFLSLYPYYIGRPTSHVRIPVEKGICGAAVREGSTIIVDDVREDDRYIACSLETRSEIVVPIYKQGKIIGEIDIDSDELQAFTDEDRKFLERVADLLGNELELESFDDLPL